MSEIQIEVVCIGFPNDDSVVRAISFLNAHQKTFQFTLLNEGRFENYQPQQPGYYLTSEIYHLMDTIMPDLRGFHNLIIGIVDGRLNGKKWSNLFGSMQENDNGRLTGKAITSTYGVPSILGLIPIELFHILEFLSFGVRFIVGKGLIHDNERGCLFHRKVQKSDILEAIAEGHISLDCQRKINRSLDLDQLISFRIILSIISEIARSSDPCKALEIHFKQGAKHNMGSKHTKVFISYSHRDNEWLELLKIHIRPYERKGLIESWDDTKIKPGSLWREEIAQALGSAKVAVLLVSAYFLASDFIADNELPRLLIAAEKRGTIILPIIVRPCLFSDSELEPFQPINPPPSAPLSSMAEHERDEVYVKAARCIKEALRE